MYTLILRAPTTSDADAVGDASIAFGRPISSAIVSTRHPDVVQVVIRNRDVSAFDRAFTGSAGGWRILARGPSGRRVVDLGEAERAISGRWRP